jgi:hypothetical protein
MVISVRLGKPICEVDHASLDYTLQSAPIHIGFIRGTRWDDDRRLEALRARAKTLAQPEADSNAQSAAMGLGFTSAAI